MNKKLKSYKKIIANQDSPHLPKNTQTYAFIDASNVIYGAKEEGWLIDQKGRTLN